MGGGLTASWRWDIREVLGCERGLGGLVVKWFAGFQRRLSPNGPPSPRLAPGGFYEKRDEGKGAWLRAEKGTGSERSEVPVPFSNPRTHGIQARPELA